MWRQQRADYDWSVGSQQADGKKNTEVKKDFKEQRWVVFIYRKREAAEM